MAKRDFKCPRCGTRLTKSDMHFALSQVHEEAQARMMMTAPLTPVICRACQAPIPADQIAAGVYDVDAAAKQSAPPSLVWVIFCPIPGALAGFLVTAILMTIPTLLFSFTTPIIIPIVGAELGAIAMFRTNLKWYRQGYTDPGVSES